MAAKRVILEMGTGNDLHGGDYTKAAVRAVQDAIHHSSLTLIRTLGLDSRKMQVEVTIGVQHPEKVDAALVKNTLPHGEVSVRVVKGGLDVPDEESGDIAVITTDLFPGLVPVINSGRVLATVHQRPVTQGRMAFQALHQFIVEGKCPLPRIRVAPHIVMSSNLELFLERLGEVEDVESMPESPIWAGPAQSSFA